jgi:hypothetical protein
VKIFPLVLGASLIANVGTLYILTQGITRSTDSAVPNAANAIRPAQVPDALAPDSTSYYADLLSRGLSVEETKPLVLARLRSELVNAVAETDKYWERTFTKDLLERGLAHAAVDDDIRAKLLAIYGPDAPSDSALRSAFLPLDYRFDFLTSEQQLALQRYQIDRQRTRVSGPVERPVLSSTQSLSQDAAQSRGTVDLEKELATHLGADGARQYLYRFSPLAEQIRSANVASSESEFRKAFDALLRMESVRDPKSYRSAREALRSEFGRDGFTRLSATRDPFFAVIEKLGQERAIDNKVLLSVYESFNDAQDQYMEIASRFIGVDSSRAPEELRGVRDQLERGLTGLVGDEVAKALLDAQSQFMLDVRKRQAR